MSILLKLFLNPRVILCLVLAGALAFSHIVVYRHGKQEVRNEWNEAIAASNSEARRLENARQSAADAAYRLAATREAGIRADAARARGQLSGLRGDLDAIQRASAQSLDAATKSVAALSNVFEQCSRSYQELAEIADGHASDSLKFQQAWPH